MSPLYVAVMLYVPCAVGDHEHEATPLMTLVVPHALSVVPPLMNRTVPVDVGPVTFAVSV